MCVGLPLTLELQSPASQPLSRIALALQHACRRGLWTVRSTPYARLEPTRTADLERSCYQTVSRKSGAGVWTTLARTGGCCHVATYWR